MVFYLMSSNGNSKNKISEVEELEMLRYSRYWDVEDGIQLLHLSAIIFK